jgi:anthranilate phosphoribosyltransferase
MLVKDAFDGNNSAVQDMIALNSGAALYISNIVSKINDGVEMAFELMNNGKAAKKLADYVKVSNRT